ncbi:MAG: hypothetical protein ACRCT6_08295, partial [Notoacmeibacter sp.]
MLVIFGIVLSYLCAHFEMFENFYEYSRSHEDWELDEIIVVVPVMAVLLGLFSFNRIRQLNNELSIRAELENKLLLDSTTNRLSGLPNETAFLDQVENQLIGAGALASGCIATIRTNARTFTKGMDGETEFKAIMGEIIRRCLSTGPQKMLLASMDNDTILMFLPSSIREHDPFLNRVAGLLSVPM